MQASNSGLKHEEICKLFSIYFEKHYFWGTISTCEGIGSYMYVVAPGISSLGVCEIQVFSKGPDKVSASHQKYAGKKVLKTFLK